MLLKDDLIGPPSMLRLLSCFFLPCQDNWIPFGRHNGDTENVHPLEPHFGKRYNVSNWINKKTYPITRIYIFTISILWEIKCTFLPFCPQYVLRTHIRKRPKRGLWLFFSTANVGRRRKLTLIWAEMKRRRRVQFFESNCNLPHIWRHLVP